MKRFFVVFLFAFISIYAYAEKYDIANLYKAIELDGAKALDSYDNVQEIKILLIPTTVKVGTYEVELTRKDTNLYKIVGTELYVETKFCHEYANRETVVMRITMVFSDKVYGEIIFDD